MAGQRIFLGYRSLQRPFAARLATDLADRGYPVWIDYLDIPVGCEWDAAIEQAIDASTAMIAVLSPSVACLKAILHCSPRSPPDA